MNKNTSSRTLYLAQLAMMIALTIIIAYFGSIMLPGGLKITFATVPVAVAGIVLGPFAGWLCGTTFGVCSLIQGITGMSALTSALILVNPFYGFLLCVVARMLCGLLPALLFRAMHRAASKGTRKASFIVSSLACPVLNTVFFMGIIVTLYWNTDPVQNIAVKLGTTNPLMFIVLLVGVQGLIEALVCAFLGSAIAAVIYGVLQKQKTSADRKPAAE